jgi:hypothetical protein
MRAKATHNLTVVTSKYADAQGQQKSRYKTIGTMFEREDGSQFLALDASVVTMELQWFVNPDHNDKVMAGLYPIEDRNDQSQQRRTQETRQETTRRDHTGDTVRVSARSNPTPDLDDEIPF